VNDGVAEGDVINAPFFDVEHAGWGCASLESTAILRTSAATKNAALPSACGQGRRNSGDVISRHQ